MLNRQTRRQLLKGSVLVSAALGTKARAQPTNGPRVTPRQDLLRMISGFQFSQMLHVAAKLRIADRLVGGPRTAAQLAGVYKIQSGKQRQVLIRQETGLSD